MDGFGAARSVFGVWGRARSAASFTRGETPNFQMSDSEEEGPVFTGEYKYTNYVL